MDKNCIVSFYWKTEIFLMLFENAMAISLENSKLLGKKIVIYVALLYLLKS